MSGYCIERIKKEIIYFEHLQQGISAYHWITLSGDWDSYVQFFQEVLKINSPNKNYVDFYYHTLSQEEKDRFISSLSMQEIHILERYQEEKEIFYDLKNQDIEFFLSISYKEILFSTFYFTKFPCTIWTNYNQRFLLFCRDTNDLKMYMNLANNYKLVIEQ